MKIKKSGAKNLKKERSSNQRELPISEHGQKNTDEHDNNSDNGLLARIICLDLLSRILDQKQALDHVLDLSSDFAALDQRDRAFVRMLLSTSLRRLGQIDDLIHRAQERPENLKTPMIRNILRLGVAQLFFMDVPDHASIDTSVRLAEHMGAERQKNFINAILRTLTRKGLEWVKSQDQSRLNTPEWLLRIWIEDYGLGKTAEITTAHLKEAPLDITLADPSKAHDWAARLDAAILPTGTLRRMTGGNVRDLDGFDQGTWWVQDAAAALPVKLMGNIQGKVIADLCAAPGGKTLQLATAGAKVFAIDRSAKRLKRLEENITRINLKENVEIIVSDAAQWHPRENIDMILLDAPCSATGTIRRHPDTPYLKTPKDIESLVGVQSKLLDHAASLLPIGGILMYCTCSLQKDEGENQIDSFLSRNTTMSRKPVTREEIYSLHALLTEQGDVRVLPCHLSSEGGMDGFFISRLIKIKA